MTGMKRCSMCGVLKDVSLFYKRVVAKDGLMSCCKSCNAAQNRAYHQAHLEYRRKQHADYYARNSIEINKKHRAYYQNNKGKVLARCHSYYQQNKAQYNKWGKAWRKGNKDKMAAYARKARQNPIKWEKQRLLKVVRRVFDHQGLSKSPTTEAICKCSPLELYRHLCNTWEKNYGAPYAGEKCEIDHIVPLKQASTIEEVQELYHYTNLQLLTKEDNRAKG